jgi:hypothetical protein
MLNVDIESLIPHREKIKIISGILEIKAATAISTAVVNSQWLLYDGNSSNSLLSLRMNEDSRAIIF